ncbi:MAG: helix-turn-helix domain containing protein [Verrucomicrobium sp.]|nr:helix-turn-helix domain containing protein [Verrucomicrobium sp.]
MSESSSFSARRLPKQKRGEQRVAALLDAAVRVIARDGYQKATASDIAREAGASIGSLYQFFPNKEAIALGLVWRYARAFEAAWAAIEADVVSGPLDRLVDEVVERRMQSLNNPAFLAMMEDAKLPPVPEIRSLLLKRLETILLRRRKASKAEAAAVAATVLYMLKALGRFCREMPAARRKEGVAEFKAALTAYLSARWG